MELFLHYKLSNMETMKFKTTIKCAGCVANVTPLLNKFVGSGNWEVDTQTPEKILTVTSGEEVRAVALITAIEQAGYKAERVN